MRRGCEGPEQARPGTIRRHLVDPLHQLAPFERFAFGAGIGDVVEYPGAFFGEARVQGAVP